MEDGLLLQTAEGLRDSTFMAAGGEIWNWLQNLKEEVSQDLIREGPLCQNETSGLRENEASVSNGREIEWLHRGQLEARLRAITNAQDRLLDGSYGKCIDCGKKVHTGRLIADPAASLCLDCQRVADGEQAFRTR
jgi:RNA polymerase-binding transcription factor DksA